MLELEQKYWTEAEQGLEEAAAFLHRQRNWAMLSEEHGGGEDVYYDTADGQLLRSGCALRFREKKGQLCYLAKYPRPEDRQGTAALAREECPGLCEEDGSHWQRIRELFGDYWDGGPMGPRLTIHKARRRMLLRQGAVEIEAALDRLIYESPEGARVPELQVELELKTREGAAELRDLSAGLEEAVPALHATQESKYQRAARLLSGEASSGER